VPPLTETVRATADPKAPNPKALNPKAPGQKGRPRAHQEIQPVAEPTDAYSAKHLSVLEGLDAVRKRPGMYIGSTDGRGLQHCLWEIFDNSVDEALGGYCTRIEVILHADGSAEVRDNGRGIPVDTERKTRLSGVELVMTRLHAGGKFGGGSYTASGGLHGVGASVVNALSARLDIEVDREGQTWTTGFRRGVAGEFAGEGPTADFTRKSGLRQIARVPRTRTGTRVRFWPDRQVFLKDATFSYDSLDQRARQTAYLVPGLAIALRDETVAEGLEEAEYRFAGGIGEFCEHLATSEKITEVIRLTGDGTFTETIPVLDDRGHMKPTEVERKLEVDVAVEWGAGYDTITRSFVNVIATPHHGTHVTGFDKALSNTINDQLRAARLLKNGDEKVTKDDILEGLTAVVSVRVPEPQFEGQTKEVLGTPAAARIVQQVVSTGLKDYFENPPRGAKQQARAVLDKIVAAAKTRIAARAASRPWPAQACPRSWSTAAQPTIAASCSSSRATPRSAPRSGLATPSSRPCCRSAARSSTCRSRRWPTCSRTPSAPRSSRSSGRARGARSTWTRPATSASFSWPTPTWTARTSARCCSRFSTATCAPCWTRAGCSPRFRRCTGLS
jgi:DNA gyrase subunit B